MSYPQFGYTYSTTPQLLVTSQGSVSSCDANRPMVTDPLTGQTVCSCQYDSRPFGFTRINSSNLQGTIYTSPYTEQTYPSISLDPAAIYPSLGAPYGLKEGSSDVAAWQSLTQPPGYYPYDPAIAAYTGYSTYDFNGARRKNATRETTATLKAWLHEHKKNPYPTKGEKIMLAIITKMTLTQVSTWFANARRRLKKENKMTWEPKNKSADDDDDEDLSDADDEEDAKKKTENNVISSGEKRENDEFPLPKGMEAKSSEREEDDDDYEEELEDEDEEGRLLRPRSQSPCRPSLTSFPRSETSSQAKPKIWSLADTATCKTPPPQPAAPLSFPSGQTWVPSLGAFQVPSVTMTRPSSHPTMNNTAVSPAMQMAPSCRQPTNGTPYSEFHTDTPPQTPPNLKMAGSCQDAQLLLPASFHSPRTLKTSHPPRLQPISTDEQRHLPLGCPTNDLQRGAAGTLFNASDLSSTAFKPIFKRENPWT